MRTGTRSIILSALSLAPALTTLSHAGAPDAHHMIGYVEVETDSNGAAIEMRGMMSIGYTESLSNAWMGASEGVNGAITFSGMNEEGITFSCSVSRTSSLYPLAVSIRSNLTSGGFLLARKSPNEDACTELQSSDSTIVTG